MPIENVFPLRVYIEDTDFTGVVYHANYLKYFERARSEWAEDLGFGIAWLRAEHIYFAIRSVQIDYLKPARVHEKLEVVSRITHRKAASFIYDQYLRLADSNGTILCKATVKVVCVGHDFRPKALPPLLEHLLHELTVEN